METTNRVEISTQNQAAVQDALLALKLSIESGESPVIGLLYLLDQIKQG